MTNAEKLKNAMRPGRVYRREQLKGATTAVDRDLRSLVARKEVKKLGGGLYYRPRKNRFGDTPPDDRDLVRAFLKTRNFLLTSFNHYNRLGLGLTQVYNAVVVYNHKRSGDFSLGGKRFQFRKVPDYPDRLSKEYLLIDMLNNLERLPDDTSRVLKNVKVRLPQFDQAGLSKHLERYGRPVAKRALHELHA